MLFLINVVYHINDLIHEDDDIYVERIDPLPKLIHSIQIFSSEKVPRFDLPLENYFHHPKFVKFHLVFFQLNPNNQYYQKNQFFSMLIFL